MVIRLIVLVLLAFSADESNGASVSLGDRILILGEINNCPEFPGILEVIQVQNSTISILNLPPIEIVGRSAIEISNDISNAIAKLRQNEEPPKTLMVKVLRSEAEYLVIREQALASARFLSSKKCQTDKPSPERRDPDWYRIARLPNQSFQRTHQSVTPFASAKVAPHCCAAELRR